MYGSTTADPTLNNFSKPFQREEKSPRGKGSDVCNPALPIPPVDPSQTQPKPLDHIDHPVLKGVQTVRNAGPGTGYPGYLAQP